MDMYKLGANSSYKAMIDYLFHHQIIFYIIYMLIVIKSECQQKTKVLQLVKGYKQGSANRTDFHIYCSVFHVDDHGVVCFSLKKISYAGLR